MAELTPNPLPAGEKCGTCRFAGTHTHSGSRMTAVMVRCLRYPPQLLRNPEQRRYDGPGTLQEQADNTKFPVLTWDDWCGEWQVRHG